MKQTCLRLFFLSALATLAITAGAEDFAYRLPDGRVQWGPNALATKVRFTDLSESQQEKLLAERKGSRSMGERIAEFAERFTPQFSAAPATRVRVLLACDTNASGGIASGVAVDLKRMNSFFRETFRDRKEVCEIEELSGAKLTADKILAYYRDLSSAATETLVCYYSGHGQRSPLGHALTLSDGSFLYRFQLLAEMQKRPHQCLILLTDCCSSSTSYDDAEIRRHRERAKALLADDLPIEMPSSFDPRTVEWLFLRHTGIIDVTAAMPSRDQYSWSTDSTGGFFTYSLVRILRGDTNSINKGQRGRVENQVDWKMAFNRVQAGAEYMSLGRRNAPSFETLIQTPAADRERIWQVPYAFSFH